MNNEASSHGKDTHGDMKNVGPLIHFTTADLNNLATGCYDLERIVFELKRTGSIVLLTKFHLIEWIPKWENAFEEFKRCIDLIDQLPIVVYSPFGLREICSQSCSFRQINSLSLLEKFLNEKGDLPCGELSQERYYMLKMGQAEFFSRNARRARFKQPGVDEKYLRKYLRLNKRHGSDPTEQWKLIEKSQVVSERVSGFSKQIYHSLPGEVIKAFLGASGLESVFGKYHARFQKAVEKFNDKLFESERAVLAMAYNVDVNHLAFCLWYDVRQELYRDLSEQGGLAEVIDLHELLYFFGTSLITVDKRIYQKLQQVFRRWNGYDFNELTQRIVKCGCDKRILARLEAFPDAVNS